MKPLTPKGRTQHKNYCHCQQSHPDGRFDCKNFQLHCPLCTQQESSDWEKQINEIFYFIHVYEGTDYSYECKKVKDILQKQRAQVLAEVEEELRNKLGKLEFDGGVDKGEDEHWHYYYEHSITEWFGKSMKALRKRLAEMKK